MHVSHGCTFLTSFTEYYNCVSCCSVSVVTLYPPVKVALGTCLAGRHGQATPLPQMASDPFERSGGSESKFDGGEQQSMWF